MKHVCRKGHGADSEIGKLFVCLFVYLFVYLFVRLFTYLFLAPKVLGLGLLLVPAVTKPRPWLRLLVPRYRTANLVHFSRKIWHLVTAIIMAFARIYSPN